jgi:hypothetical protein
MKIRQMRGGPIEESGTLPTVLQTKGNNYLTTTIFVKYNYREVIGAKKELVNISVICLPNGMLQERYNPTARDTIWLAGRNAPSRGEVFRVRVSLQRLKRKANWRVQYIPSDLAHACRWDD